MRSEPNTTTTTGEIHRAVVHRVQLMMDNGPEVASLATGLRELLEELGEFGASVLTAAPPLGGRSWKTTRALLVTVPAVAASDA